MKNTATKNGSVMAIREIRAEAQSIVNDIFWKLLETDEKEQWKKALDFIKSRIIHFEIGERGFNMFIWREVQSLITTQYGKKFVLRK